MAISQDIVDGVAVKTWDTDAGTVNGAAPTEPSDIARLAELQAEETQIARAAESKTERTALTADLQTLRDERDQARDNRLKMVSGDDLYQNRWNDVDSALPTPLDGTGTNGARIAALETAVNDLNTRHVDVANLVNTIKTQVRSLWGTHRLTLTNLIRAVRAGQLDES